MLRRFGTWMYRYQDGFALAVVVAGVIALPLNANGGVRGIEMAFWQSQAQACGVLVVVSMRGSSGDPQAATTCLQAYAHCHAATLVESFSGLDTSETVTFAIEPQLFAGGAHPCSIQLNLAFGVIFANRRSNKDWVTCAGVAQRPDGLLFFGCGQYGTILVSTE
jgi:hypothetical protein